MVNNDIRNTNWARAKLKTIKLILCKNNQAGKMPAGTDANPARSIDLKRVNQEMIDLLKMFQDLEDIVENIENSNVKMIFEKEIDTLKNVRRDIRDETQDIINDKNKADDQVPDENGPPAINPVDFLVIEGGGMRVFKDWT